MLALLRILAMQKFLMDEAGDGGTGGGGSGDSKEGSDNPGGSSDKSKDPNPGDPDPDDGEDELDDFEFSEKQQKYIKKLRKENAAYRKRAQAAEGKMTGLDERLQKLEGGLKKMVGGEDPDETPEETRQRLENEVAANNFNRAVLESVVEFGVPKDGIDYFKFLIQQEAEKLEDDAEITEETLSELAEKAKAQVKGSTAGKTTSAGGTDQNPNPNPGGKGSGVKVEQFVKMSIAEKSALYQKDKAAYEALLSEAKDKRLL